MKTRVFCIAILVVLSLALPAAAQECSSLEFKAALGKVKAQQAGLLAYELKGEIDETVPPPLQAQIRSFKDALTALGDAELACSEPNVNPKTMESLLAKLLDANKPAVQEVYDPNKPPQLDHIYGDELTVKVTEPDKSLHLLLIEFNFGIECGADSILLAYEWREGRWQRALRWQSGDYSEIKDAYGDFFEYIVLPRPEAGRWLLAAAHGSPWCTSRWSGFGLDLVQPATAQAPQKVLQHIEQGYVRFEITPVMKLVPEGFQLRVETGMIDTDLMTRVGIYRYRVSGNQLERVQPIANNGRDFVDEWLQVRWTDAARWSSAETLEALHIIHARIGKTGDDEKSPNYTFGPVRGCSDSAAHFQVELKAEWFDGKGHSKPAGTTYFQIEQGKNAFTMQSASSTPDSRCKGPNIMKAQ